MRSGSLCCECGTPPHTHKPTHIGTHMKSKKLSAKIKALLASNNNVPPATREEALAFFGQILGTDTVGWETTYFYSVKSYVAVPRSDKQKNAHVRRAVSKMLFAFLTICGLTKDAAAGITEQTTYKQRYTPYTTPVVLTAMQRARARKLTPKGRGYRTAIGIEIEGQSPHDREDLAAALPLFTKVVYDGSIEVRGSGTAAEVIALLNRDEMEPRLHRLCTKLGQMGFSTNKSCGLHIHIDCRHLSFEQVCVRAKIIDKWIKALVELVPVSRRDNRYCKIGFSSHDRYRAVNVTSYSKHQTLEIRIHSSTSNYQKALAWIRLCELLFGLRKAPKAATGCLSVLDQLPLAEYERSYWRARHAQLNPSQYMGAVVSPTGGEE